MATGNEVVLHGVESLLSWERSERFEKVRKFLELVGLTSENDVALAVFPRKICRTFDSEKVGRGSGPKRGLLVLLKPYPVPDLKFFIFAYPSPHLKSMFFIPPET